MKKLIPLVLFGLVCVAASAENFPPQPLASVTFRGEEIPVYAAQAIQPKEWVEPHYPGWARQAQMEGQVTLTLLVGADGKVSEHEKQFLEKALHANHFDDEAFEILSGVLLRSHLKD